MHLVKTPELAVEITLQPVNAFDLDAAIIYSDILPPLEAMGLQLEFAAGEGPVIHNPLRSPADVNALRVPDPADSLGFMLEALRLARAELDGRIPLIGFAGAPFTLATYAVEGGGSRNQTHTKQLMYAEPETWRRLMDKLARTVGAYLQAQAEAGAQALQVDAAGGWKLNAKLNAKAYLATLGTKGVKITADVTAFAADMTTPWMQVEIVINAQNNDGAGANNNIGWNGLGGKDVLRDGQPHTYTWELPDALTAKIAGANDSIGWFELALVSNLDNASVTRFYIDNIQLVTPEGAANTGKSTDTIIGNWEESMDGWAVAGGADVRYSDANGVTLGQHSLDVYTKTGAWASVLTLNLMDPNNAAVRDAFFANTKVTADITRLVVDWPVDDIPPWNGIHFIINCGGDGWSLWQDLGYRAGWSQNNGDRTDSVTWDYSPYLSRIQRDNLTWCSLEVVVNANSANYKGWVWFYLDNMRLSGGGIALDPKPANGAEDVNVETQLSWTAAGSAATHNLYLGASSGAVAAADGASDPSVLFVPLDVTSFDPDSLAFNTQYFWRVDEVNDANPDSPWKGPVWNFTTGNFTVVDDFESYEDVVGEGKAIFDTWLDGWENPANGSVVGNAEAPFAETKTVHGGAQAMPLAYDNTTAAVSEATRTWAEPTDWTINGFNCLKLFVAGGPSNVAGIFYVAVKDSAGTASTVERDVDSAFTAETWTELEFPLNQFSGVNMASVSSMTLGVKNKAGAKALGTLLVDDIRVGFKAMGLVAHYKLEDNVQDSSGNGLHGTLSGDPNFPVKYVSGPAGFGQGLLFNGTGGHQNVELGTFNPSAATGHLTVALWAKWNGLTNQWQGLIGKRDGWAVDNMLWDIEINRDSGTIQFRRIDSYPNSGGRTLPIGQWTHVAATFDGTTARFYIDGVETGSGNFSFGQDKEAALHFGSGDPNGGNAFNGTLDDVRLYDKALTAAEVKALLTAK
jgi:hypothetical protein